MELLGRGVLLGQGFLGREVPVLSCLFGGDEDETIVEG